MQTETELALLAFGICETDIGKHVGAGFFEGQILSSLSPLTAKRIFLFLSWHSEGRAPSLRNTESL